MKNKKILINILSMVIMLFLCTTVVFADAASVAGMDIGNSGNNTILNSGKNIIGIAQVIGVGVAVTMLIVLAISYMVAAPSDKAEIKKHAVVYVVGAIFIFATSAIVSLAQAIAGNVK